MSEQIIRKAGEPTIAKKSDDGKAYTFVISSENEDLVGDVVVQRGMKPIRPKISAQLDHSGEMMKTVGVWDNIRTIGKQTLADLVLYPQEVNHQPANLIRSLLDKGWQLACSIGFRSDDAEFRDPKKGYGGGMLYKSTTLVETSIVVVGCHPEALSVSKSLGYGKDIVDMVLEPRNDDEDIDRQMRYDDVLARAKRLVKSHTVV